MAGAVGAFAVAAAIGFKFAVVTVAQQRVVVGICFKVDAAAVAAVAAGGSAAGHIFFAAKRDATVAAFAGFHKDFGFINKHKKILTGNTARNRGAVQSGKPRPSFKRRTGSPARYEESKVRHSENGAPRPGRTD
jgi:hypothetical protein